MMGPGLKDYLDYFSRRKHWARMSISSYYAETFLQAGFVIWLVVTIGTAIIFPNQPRWIKHLLFILFLLSGYCIGYFYGISLSEKTGKKFIRELLPFRTWFWTKSRAIRNSIAVFFGLVIIVAVVVLIDEVVLLRIWPRWKEYSGFFFYLSIKYPWPIGLIIGAYLYGWYIDRRMVSQSHSKKGA